MEAVGFVVLNVTIRAADGQYAARCVELGTATCGETRDEAWENILDAVEHHLNALEELGIRDRVFEEAGVEVFSLTEPSEGTGTWRPLGTPRPSHHPLPMRVPMPAHAL